MEIAILDTDVQRIRAIEQNLACALKSLRLKACIKIVSEPPFLCRENLLCRLPVLEIDGYYWSLKPDQVISEDQCRNLLARITHKGASQC